MAAKTKRLEMRVSAEHKRLIERAAAVTGQPVTAFAISNLVERAREVLDQHEVTTLGRRDYDAFLRLLDEDRKPPPALVRAMKRVKESGE